MTTLIEQIQLNLVRDDLWKYIIDGLETTIIVTVCALLIGFVLGLLLAIIRLSYKGAQYKTTAGRFIHKILYSLADFYITLIRGTPTTIQLLMMFNVFLISIDNLRLVAILTFGMNSSAYMAEVFRGGMQSVDKGEIEAARSLSLTYPQTMRHVIFPQGFRNALPALGNETITLFKETSICGFIGLMDLTRASNIIISKTFSAFIPYATAALIYLVIVLCIEKIFFNIERRVTPA